MDKKTTKRLNKLNQRFYEMVGDDFSASRNYFWEGWEKCLPYFTTLISNGLTPTKSLSGKLSKRIKVLDVGCGNGRFAKFLIKSGFQIEYLGIDSSKKLLNLAVGEFDQRENREKNKAMSVKFERVDILKGINVSGKFDLIVCFGVLHHIPGLENRRKFLEEMFNKLNTGGLLIVTNWRFLESEKLKVRLIAPESIGVDPSTLEENDYFLDWKRGKNAIRYCHNVTKEEMAELVSGIKNLTLAKTFLADSKSHNLNRYFIFTKIE